MMNAQCYASLSNAELPRASGHHAMAGDLPRTAGEERMKRSHWFTSKFVKFCTKAFCVAATLLTLSITEPKQARAATTLYGTDLAAGIGVSTLYDINTN